MHYITAANSHILYSIAYSSINPDVDGDYSSWFTFVIHTYVSQALVFTFFLFFDVLKYFVSTWLFHKIKLKRKRKNLKL